MQVQINVGQETSSHELRSLAIFFNHLATAGEVVSVGQPAVIEKLQVQVVPVASQIVDPAVVADAQPGSQPPEAGSEKTRRTRRTKAEIEAARNDAKPAAEDATTGSPEPEGGQLGGGPLDAGEKIDTETGEITEQVATDNGTAPVEEFETVTGGKTYTEAEVQNLASSVARAKGPQIVKDKIAELGATRIAALTADQLNSLGAFLETQK